MHIRVIDKSRYDTRAKAKTAALLSLMDGFLVSVVEPPQRGLPWIVTVWESVA